jgi:sphingolipid delta-4 desaturase
MPPIDFRPKPSLTEEALRAIKNKKLEDDAFDCRHPLYVGLWKRSIPGKKVGPVKDDLDEPHVKRRHAILKKHPEIKNLNGPVASTKWIALGLTSTQISLAYYFSKVYPNNYALVATAYFVGGTITSLAGVVIHEVTHGLTFKSVFLNRMLGLFVNSILPVPIAMSFRRYHLEHHAYQGVLGRDPDLPLEFEYKLIGANPVGKFLFMLFFPVMYIARGAALCRTPSFWEIVNFATVAATDYLIYKNLGPKALLYLGLSMWFGYSIHLGAAHFIQEHYTVIDGQETYSYYGSLNNVAMNIGYHNEHHDFTQVPLPYHIIINIL